MKKSKNIRKDDWFCNITYEKIDIEEQTSRLESIIADKKNIISLIEQKKQAKKNLLIAELAVMEYCLEGWRASIKDCNKKIKKLQKNKSIKRKARKDEN